MNRKVIVGAGTAAMHAVRRLRELGDKAPLTVVSAEPPYARMVLPYLLKQQIRREQTQTLSPDTLRGWGVDLRLGVRAVELDGGAQQVLLDDGSALPYQSLLLATGSKPVLPPLPGVQGARVVPYWSMAHHDRLEGLLHEDAHVVIVGAGFIAFTILEGLLARCARVSIVEAETQVLPRMLTPTAAKLLQERLKAAGVELYLGTTVQAFEEVSGGVRVELANGKTLQADASLLAVGVTPATEWLTHSGLGSPEELAQGIKVNDQLETRLPHVFAAGDLALGKELVSGQSALLALETTAAQHGRLAASHMAGKATPFAGALAMNVIGVAGLVAASVGHWNWGEAEGAEVIALAYPERSAVRHYVLKEGRMVGGLLMGTTEEVWANQDLGMMRGLVASAQVLTAAQQQYLAQQPFDLKPLYLASGQMGHHLAVTGSPGPTLI